MDDKLCVALKENMGYSEPHNKKCKDCKYSKERDGFSDREWIRECFYHAVEGRDLGEFTVGDNNYCNKFKPVSKR